jgi:hypothetical protein
MYLRVCLYPCLSICRVGVPGAIGSFLYTRAWCSGIQRLSNKRVLHGSEVGGRW